MGELDRLLLLTGPGDCAFAAADIVDMPRGLNGGDSVDNVVLEELVGSPPEPLAMMVSCGEQRAVMVVLKGVERVSRLVLRDKGERR